MCVIANSSLSPTPTIYLHRIWKWTQETLNKLWNRSESSSADPAPPAPGGYNHLGGHVYGSTSGSVHTEKISNTCAAVLHPENLMLPGSLFLRICREICWLGTTDASLIVPLSVVHHISCSLHFVWVYGGKPYKQHRGKSLLFTGNPR